MVPKNTEPLRLTEYLLQLQEEFLPGIPTRNFIKKQIKLGNITVEGHPATTAVRVQPGMKIELLEAERKPLKIYELSFPVIFEDEHLAIISNPEVKASSL